MANTHTDRQHVRLLERWLKSTALRSCSPRMVPHVPEVLELAPTGQSGCQQPYANGGAVMRQLVMPGLMDHCVAVPNRRRRP